MPTHAEQRQLPFTPEQMFDLVADIGSYPQFLPWCVNARIRKRDGKVVTADLIVGFRMIKEKFTSQVVLSRPGAIDVEYLDGPLKSLRNSWQFKPGPDGKGCCIDFYVNFEFRTKMLQKLAELFFNEVVSRMVAAFEARAYELYGGGTTAPAHAVPATRGTLSGATN